MLTGCDKKHLKTFSLHVHKGHNGKILFIYFCKPKEKEKNFMNEKLQYATMLEIPVNTCNVTLKQPKKRRFFKRREKNPEQIKEQLVRKVNAENGVDENREQAILADTESENISAQTELDAENYDYTTQVESEENIHDGIVEDQTDQESTVSITTQAKSNKKRFKFSVIGVQFAIIGALVATIFLTNALYTDSGINVFFRNVFKPDTTVTVDYRTHADFAPIIEMGGMSGVTVEEGVMTFTGEGSVYSSCDGKVTAISHDENGKYTIEITHSDNFKSVITGMDFVYSSLNDSVFFNIPVGYASADGATMCFKGANDVLISDYQIIDGSVVWAV